MARTRTPGIRIDRHGPRIIDKDTGAWASIFGSAQRVKNMLNKGWPTRLLGSMLSSRNANPPPRFADCAA